MMEKLQMISTPIARVLLSITFIAAGLGKITDYAGTQAYMEAMSVPGALLPLVIALEVLGGLAVLVGFQARLAALCLAGFTVIAAVLFHSDFTDQMQMIMFTKNVAIAGGFLMIFAQGAGAYSFDARRA